MKNSKEMSYDAYWKAYYATNRDKILAQEKAYNAAHPLKSVWKGMMQRCGHYRGASARLLARYAGRGITVCPEWHHFPPFESWSLANGWQKGLQLDRIDNNRGYFPDNCRFVTRTQNQRNKRSTLFFDNGWKIADWYEEFKTEISPSYTTFVIRVLKLGWGVHDALYTPSCRRKV